MTIPIRVQRSRRKGATHPDGTVFIDRTGKYGNPWAVVYLKAKNPPEISGNRFILETGWYITDKLVTYGPFDEMDAALDKSLEKCEKWIRYMLASNPGWLDELKAAKFIACPCSISEKCHGDIYIKILREMETE